MNDSLKNHSGPGRDFPPATATRRPLSAGKKKNVSRLTRRYFTLNAATVGLNIIQGGRRLELVILERVVKVRRPFYARKDPCTTGLRMLNQTGSAFFFLSPLAAQTRRDTQVLSWLARQKDGWRAGPLSAAGSGERGLFCGRLHTQTAGRPPQQLHLWRVKGREVRVHAAHCCQCNTGHRDWNQSIHPSMLPSFPAHLLPSSAVPKRWRTENVSLVQTHFTQSFDVFL